MAVLYGTTDCTADSIIERLVGMASHPGQVTVITADGGERETVEAMGALCLSPDWLREELSAQSSLWKETLNQVHRRSRW
jgi:predicted RNA-binding protein with PIN domain